MAFAFAFLLWWGAHLFPVGSFLFRLQGRNSVVFPVVRGKAIRIDVFVHLSLDRLSLRLSSFDETTCWTLRMIFLVTFHDQRSVLDCTFPLSTSPEIESAVAYSIAMAGSRPRRSAATTAVTVTPVGMTAVGSTAARLVVIARSRPTRQ